MAVKLSRRQFLMGCSAAIAALAGSRVTNLAFASNGGSPEALIVLFLRGGWDGLNVVPPIAVGTDRGIYETSRPTLKIPTSGTGAALNLNGFFGFHPSLAPLLSLYQAQKLAVIHAAGLVYDTRSHFDAMQFMELGTPGVKTTNTGWLARYLETLSLNNTGTLPAISAGSNRATSLFGYGDAISMTSASAFNVGGSSTYRAQQTNSLRNLYGSAGDWLDAAGLETVQTIDLIQSKGIGTYTPANGALYPSGSFGDNLKLIAQMIKANVGLTTATVDLGGWDTHENQGDAQTATSYMFTLLGTLANGLKALYTDLDGCGASDYNGRTTIVVMSEFGRRLKENASRGTDHGHGNVMLVLGKNVKGGQVYGSWPGLSNAQLYQNSDLAVATDYRRVFSEILARRLGRNNTHLTSIFPSYTQEAPLDFMVDGYVAPLPPAGPYSLYLPVVSRQTSCP